MYGRDETPWERDQARSERIRRLREQRQGPLRRRRTLEPIVLLLWFAGVAALAGVLIILGFFAFAPRLMAWVEDNPGAIDHGIVQDFVQWHQPDALADLPASDTRQRVTVEIEQGATDEQIGTQLAESGLIRSELAFHWAVIQAGREGTLAFGVYDLSPTMRPSEIVATLRGIPFEVTTVTIREGLRLEQIVAVLAESELTMNLEEFATLVRQPPADLLNQFDFLNELPPGRSLEGYLYPNTYEFQTNAEPREVVSAMLNEFGARLTPEMRDGIVAQGLSIDEAVILASIVEREAVIEEERPLIAGVFVSRISDPENPQHGGLLNADPTLQYGLATVDFGASPVDQWGTIEWWPPLQVGGAEVVLPEELAGYQTYLVPGLPPTPIAAPRDTSLAAVAAPALDAGYLFFTAGCPNGVRDGSHYFAATLDQHEANNAQALSECAGQ